MLKQMQERRGSDEGFTLIELLIAIVVIGVLSAVVIVGIGGLTDSGQKSACKTSADAAKAATAVFYANNNGTYPITFTSMTGSAPKMLELSGGTTVDVTGLIASGTGWILTMAPGAPIVPAVVPAASLTVPTYTCTA